MKEHTLHTHNPETFDTEDSFFVHEKKALHEIKPSKALLTSILHKLDEEKSTAKNYNPYTSRNEHHVHSRKGIAILSPYMRYMKMVSGAAFASALVFMFILKGNTTPNENPTTFAVQTSPNAKIASVAGEEPIDVDTILAELDSAATVAEEPTLDDSDILNDLSNTNTYEIQ